MNFSESIQVVIDQQLSIGHSYRDIIIALENTTTELRKLDDIAFITENPLDEIEMALVKSYAHQNSYSSRVVVPLEGFTPYEEAIKHYRERMVRADFRRAKLAVDTYLQYLIERDRGDSTNRR